MRRDRQAQPVVSGIVRERINNVRPSHRLCATSQRSCARRAYPSQTMCTRNRPLLRVLSSEMQILLRLGEALLTADQGILFCVFRVAAVVKAQFPYVPNRQRQFQVDIIEVN